MAKNTIAAVGYARRSTDLQERSIPDQQAYVEKWAVEHRYRIIRWYVDDAISGASTRGRDQFEQMIADALAKKLSTDHGEPPKKKDPPPPRRRPTTRAPRTRPRRSSQSDQSVF